MDTNGLLLRGSQIWQRTLQEGEPAYEAENTGGDQRNGNSTFVMVATVILSMILVGYILCVFHMIYIYIRRRFFGMESIPRNVPVIVNDGRILNLTTGQRRAVLEKILAETSKAVTEDDVGKRKVKRKVKKNTMQAFFSSGGDDDDDDDVDKIPVNIEVKGEAKIMLCGTVDSMYDDDDDDDGDSVSALEIIEEGKPPAQEQEPPTTPKPIQRTQSWDGSKMEKQGQTPPAIQLTRSNSWDSPALQRNSSFHSDSLTPKQSGVRDDRTMAANSLKSEEESDPSPGIIRSEDDTDLTKDDSHDEAHYASSAIGPDGRGLVLDEANASEIRRSFPLYTLDEARPSFCDVADLQVPTLTLKARSPQETIEDDNDNDEKQSPSFLPIPLTRADSATVASEYTFVDDETEENICPICICGYEEGETIVKSKHCVHWFHKDCILEWLDKHGECPICRVQMVTEIEIQNAATSLSGRNRVTRSVAALNSVSNHRVVPAMAAAHQQQQPQPQGDYPMPRGNIHTPVRGISSAFQDNTIVRMQLSSPRQYNRS